jgi:prepilin-type N-terminal cleavage/methylation domain-containing protein
LIKLSLKSSGFTLFEIIIALFIISIAVIPMMKSFGPAMSTAAIVEKTAVMTNQARATMERLLVLDFNTLKSKVDDSQPLSGNDVFGDSNESFTFEGASYAPEITIIDSSGDTSKTLLTLTVAIDDISVSTLKAEY